MKILGTETIREEHEAHTIENACKLARVFGHESIFVKSIDEALERVRQEQFDWILIHHIDFRGVRALRGVSPNSKYLGFSSLVVTSPHSVGYEFGQKMLRDYDIAVGPLGMCDKLEEIFSGR